MPVLYLVMTPHAQAMIPAAGTNIPSLSDLKGDGKPSLPAMDMRGSMAGAAKHSPSLARGSNVHRASPHVEVSACPRETRPSWVGGHLCKHDS
ncbi:hypothetical protein RRG08_022296 [Elysia crispata]|uniref:Uncharacterized protein n=1 Tax=Elysia crispata TaxID=231223 RepID=A0AAE0ZQN6_9GAST|nr:hypothetical protein RRG08_022296 [Elysia crispata]